MIQTRNRALLGVLFLTFQYLDGVIQTATCERSEPAEPAFQYLDGVIQTI